MVVVGKLSVLLHERKRYAYYIGTIRGYRYYPCFT
jgi:hypothetical protein